METHRKGESLVAAMTSKQLEKVGISLIRENLQPYSPELRVNEPEKVADLFSDLSLKDREYFEVLALNMKNKPLKRYNVAIGSLNATIVHPREVLKMACILGAASIILVHNHPSGDPTPSGADIQLTRRLTKAADVLGISVCDHIIIGADDTPFVSLMEMGLM